MKINYKDTKEVSVGKKHLQSREKTRKQKYGCKITSDGMNSENHTPFIHIF